MSIPLVPDPKEPRTTGVTCTKRGPQSWGVTWPTPVRWVTKRELEEMFPEPPKP